MGLVNTGDLSTPLRFGSELSGQPIPTQDLGGGVVAWMNVDGTVSDGAAGGSFTPEPASFSLFAAGGILIVVGACAAENGLTGPNDFPSCLNHVQTPTGQAARWPVPIFWNGPGFFA